MTAAAGLAPVIATAVDSDLAWAWWATLGAGVVVAAVVALLLHLLLRTVRQIHAGLDAVWTMGKQVAANTATTWMIGEGARKAGLLEEELARRVKGER